MSTVWDVPAWPDAGSSGPGPAAEEAAPFAAFCAELAEALSRPAERKRNLCRLAEALGVLGDASVALCVPQPGGRLACEIGTGELAQLEGDLLPVDGTLEGDAFTSGQAQESENLRIDPRAYLGLQRDLPNTPAVALPMEAAGERTGVALFASRRHGHAFTGARLDTLGQALTLVTGALRNFAVHERARASRSVLEAVRGARGSEAEAMRKVLRAVRHELNTPLSVILGNLQLCASEDAAEWRMTAPELRRAVHDGATRLEALSRLLHAWEESDAAVDFDREGRFVSPPVDRPR
jgi:signal transduction histidine kinase